MENYVISVSLGTGCYRHIQISASATLYKPAFEKLAEY